MNEPKRHHWWPQLQSGAWSNAAGKIYACDQNGATFQTSPVNVGVEKDLYTQISGAGEKSREIEIWFSKEIEGPFKRALDRLIDEKSIRAERFAVDKQKIPTTEKLGFVADDIRRYIPLDDQLRNAVASYVSALIVRHPAYIQKIEAHIASGHDDQRSLRNASLDNMLYVFGIYREVLVKSEFVLTKAIGSNEFLFSDGGISVQEPWRTNGIPFDVCCPLTPQLALSLFPVPRLNFPDKAVISLCRNEAVRRINRIALSSANRFVFCRSRPPVRFITKYFGVPAPTPYGHRLNDGEVEIEYDSARDGPW